MHHGPEEKINDSGPPALAGNYSGRGPVDAEKIIAPVALEIFRGRLILAISLRAGFRLLEI